MQTKTDKTEYKSARVRLPVARLQIVRQISPFCLDVAALFLHSQHMIFFPLKTPLLPSPPSRVKSFLHLSSALFPRPFATRRELYNEPPLPTRARTMGASTRASNSSPIEFTKDTTTHRKLISREAERRRWKGNRSRQRVRGEGVRRRLSRKILRNSSRLARSEL